MTRCPAALALGILTCTLVAATTAAAQEHEPRNLNGGWNVMLSFRAEPVEGELRLRHSRAGRVSGTWRGRGDASPESNLGGRYVGETLRITFSMLLDGEPVEVQLRANVGPDEIDLQGSMQVGEETGTWHANRSVGPPPPTPTR